MALPLAQSSTTSQRPHHEKASDQVDYTISQDRAAGNSAQEESDFQLLTGKGIDLAGPPAESASVTELMDYQMQLMLLEQQNKKRLMMARQNQAAMSRPSSDPFREQVQPGGSRKRMRVEYNEMANTNSKGDSNGTRGDEGLDVERPYETHQSDDQSLKVESLIRFVKASPQALEDLDEHLHSPQRAGNPKKRFSNAEQSQGGSPKSDTRADSLHAIQNQRAEGIEEDESSDGKLNTNQPTAPGYCILYRVVCSDRREHCHLRIYLDEPRRVSKQGFHLIGNTLVPDLDDYLHSRKEVSFIVYRDYFCKQGTRSSMSGSSTDNPGTKYGELFSIMSEDLHATIQRRSKFAPNKDAYKLDRFDYGDQDLSPALSMAFSEYSHRFLYHHRAELSAEAETTTKGSLIRALVSYMAENPSNMYNKCDHLFSKGLVSHDTLPWLFHPNDVLVASAGPLEIAYVLRRFPKEGPRLDLDCWNWGYDGHWLRRTDTRVSVDVPTYSTIRINELAVYPLRFATEETKGRLLNNGQKFWNLRHQSFVSYEGPDFKGERIFPSDSRCMLDYQIYYKFHPSSEAFHFSMKNKATYDQWPDTISNNSSLRPIDMVLLPSGIHGFFMKEKKWVHLLVAQIQPVNWNKAAFERLVLPKRSKNIIKGLVMVRKPTPENPRVQIGLKGKRDDIIAGKGSGLIMLLHGGPGTGKTLTAGKDMAIQNQAYLTYENSVAELAEMPLYSVTCGDIGTGPEAVEKYLNSVLHLGRKWNCVLLLDEADVFLEERSLQDLERNSLVSVFLRTLEYYDGVLILTSNRVGTFDEAFKSRIQLALHYPPLDAPSRRKIWRNFLDILTADNENMDVDDIVAHMDKLSSYEMNGRQIRNALTTARQLALFEQETLDWDRIKDSIEVANDFNRYLVDVHGHTEEQWSRENNLR
ncbi:hypothetical protein F4678DRAFT_460182 [Xylaria arbuscula]|nr:hypothetical protein F4678DRAFT_460182 [Xylaria arbuscula]